MVAITQKARERDPAKRLGARPFIPQGMEDIVARISAAGQRIMYSPQMRDELKAAVASKAPIAQKLAESVTGLMLTLDQKMPGGIPEEALFPAALDLLGEASDALTEAGQKVTRTEYGEAALLMFVLMARKLGYSDEQIMGVAAKAVGATPEEARQAIPAANAMQGARPPAGQAPQAPEEAGEQPGQPDEEEQAMQEGFQA
ncbi:hypothetical protein [Aquabacterium sp.]|uniref:hypothetical protein n=1 Tax=Aquabacterium sp. TaxID=1872578 RepID=UPI0037852B85